jgi:hypothetical protein
MSELPPENAVAPVEDASAPNKASSVCKQHPNVAALFCCQLCAVPICNTCAFHEADGSYLCPECKLNQPPPPRLISGAPPVISPALDMAPRVVIPATARCVQHPNVAATQECKLCGCYMCMTCSFDLPNGVHICPACASEPRPALGSKGKKLLIWSYVAAIWSTVGLAALVSGVFGGMAHTPADQQMLGIILMIFVLAPAIAGLSLAAAAKRPRQSNPPSLWIALIWNSIIVGCFVLLTIIGLFS